MSGPRHLVAFVRQPRLGRVKTRLARDLGPVAALRLYRQMMDATLRRLHGRGRWHRWLAITPDAAAAAPGPWPPGWRRAPQGPGDLGRRMARVMRTLPPGEVIIIGTDVPDIRPDHVVAAFAALGHHRAVFGPAGDGGYWLVGLSARARRTDVFAGVRWSTPFALDDTLANLGGSSVARLETLDDIDDGAALGRWRRATPPSARGPHLHALGHVRAAQCLARERST